ncbi:MAG: imidazoleglycerol-phosphate dehydratase HisB [Clostridia bacterium]|nr:imidazoleglycerol-phosphate dehydratase HisB [Clostridia bacterium]
MKRTVQVERITKETAIKCILNMDGTGQSKIKTGIGFLDHMLTLMCFYGQLDLELEVKGDLQVDCHHTVEDIGIVIGNAVSEVLGDRRGIKRYGQCFMPMDETLSQVVLDFSGRPVFVYDCDFLRMDLGTLDVQTIKEFFKSLSYKAQMNLHMRILYGENDHHKAESLFKGFGMALKEGCGLIGNDVFSTKGVLV